MDKKELKDQVSLLVAQLFDEKEEAEIRQQTQIELEKSATTISELTSALEKKNTEYSNIEEQFIASEDRIKELETKLEAAKKELETASKELVETKKALEDINKDRAAEKRMLELEDAGVARSDKEDQMTKVREMSDEEFASYKGELVSIREAVVAELKKAHDEAQSAADAKAKEDAAKGAKKKMVDEEEEMMDDEEDEEEDPKKMKKNKKKEKSSGDSKTSEETTSEETASEDDENKTIPANIPPGQAAMASLNMEYIPSGDIVAKYAELGKAMAANFKKDKKSE